MFHARNYSNRIASLWEADKFMSELRSLVAVLLHYLIPILSARSMNETTQKAQPSCGEPKNVVKITKSLYCHVAYSEFRLHIPCTKILNRSR